MCQFSPSKFNLICPTNRQSPDAGFVDLHNPTQALFVGIKIGMFQKTSNIICGFVTIDSQNHDAVAMVTEFSVIEAEVEREKRWL
jgi:hypothetical protein